MNIGKKIMKELIIKYLKGKTLFVVTHALQYLKYMYQIIKEEKLQNWMCRGNPKSRIFLSMKELSKLNKESNVNE